VDRLPWGAMTVSTDGSSTWLWWQERHTLLSGRVRALDRRARGEIRNDSSPGMHGQCSYMRQGW
jgi:hypothetical protein